MSSQSLEPESVLGSQNVEPESVLGSQSVEPDFGARVCTWEPECGARVCTWEPGCGARVCIRVLIDTLNMSKTIYIRVLTNSTFNRCKYLPIALLEANILNVKKFRTS